MTFAVLLLTIYSIFFLDAPLLSLISGVLFYVALILGVAVAVENMANSFGGMALPSLTQCVRVSVCLCVRVSVCWVGGH